MLRNRAIGGTATLLTVLVAAGCGGANEGASSASTSPAQAIATGEPTTPHPTKPATPEPSAPTSATTRPTATSSGTAAGAPGVPEAARQHTRAGAVAFSRHYWDLVNQTAVKPKVGVLDALATKQRKTCRNFANSVRLNVKHGQRWDRPEGRITKAEWRTGSVWMEIDPIESWLIEQRTGNHVKFYPDEENFIWVISLTWTSDGWRLTSMKVADQSLW